ncbi:MAG: methylmalonyl-CoA mutase [Euryarchaeota archaeon]|nr:methylmalonyl-CoA mutase [Euryarchaeota archaeon]
MSSRPGAPKDGNGLDEYRKRYRQWDEAVRKGLGKAPESPEQFETLSGLPVKRLYTPLDSPGDPGFPGEYPYTRGIYPTGYRGRLWTMRQYAGFESAAETNQKFKYLLSQGQTGLSVAFDLPTQMGYDPDHMMSAGEVGKVGVSIASLRDMEAVYDGIPLERVSSSMTINATAPILLAYYVAVAEKQGVSLERISGTVQNDIIKEYIARGTYIFPPGPSLRLAADTIRFAVKRVPRWNPISICGYHYREAGASAVQEIAFTMAAGMAYTEQVLRTGTPIDEFAPRFSFFHCVHNDLFEEIAKFRAMRRMWARLMKENYRARDPRSWQFRFAVQTSGVVLTAQQPENNIIRSTIHTLAAVLGGVQSIQLACFDEALALPTDFAQRTALRTQQIIAHESGVTHTVDPLGGSHFLESLTDELEEGARRYIREIEKMGRGSVLQGVIRGLEEGYFQKEAADAAYKFQREVDSGRRTIVGVNKYRQEETRKVQTFKIDPEVQRRQMEALKKLKAERDSAKAEAALRKLEKAARTPDEDLMAPILDAARAYATTGEMCDILRGVFGTYRPKVIF